MKKPKKPVQQERKEVIIIRVSAREKALIEYNADMYADGNISGWVRLAAIKYEKPD